MNFQGLKTTLCLLLLFIHFPIKAYPLDVPSAPTGYVNDRAGMLDAASRAELEQKLKSFEETTSNQVIVATFPSLEGESLEDFSIRLAEKWKIGQKGRDNGAILLIFKNDRKLRIEVGYGLEGALPDATSKSIIENVITPRFKQGDFKGGIFAGIDAMMAATKGEYRAPEPQPYRRGLGDWLSMLFVIFIFLIFMPMLFYAALIRPILSLFFPRRFPPRRSSYSGGSSGWSSGSWSSGGSSWGSSGGGFSGGGGSFGGGGASGSW
jgi:uncharacterized protein